MCRERPHSTCLAPAPPLLPAKRTVGHAASEAALLPASAASRLLPSVPPKLRPLIPPKQRDEAASARPGDQMPRPPPEDETDQDYDIPAASPVREAEAQEYEEYDEPVPVAAKNTGTYYSLFYMNQDPINIFCSSCRDPGPGL